MHLGVFSFNTEYTIRADELAVAVEERGLESVWFPEHTHIPASRETPWPGNGPLPREYVHMSDPFASAAAAAVMTKTIKIGTGISLVIQHDPIALAKTVATVDRLSDGRFEFGVGAGWNKEEMANHGVAFEQRWRVLTEYVRAMKALWTQEEATFHGESVSFERVWSYPKPVQQPHPPIVLGTFGSSFGRKRVVELADGWIPIGLFHTDIRADIEDLRRRLAEQGRDPDSVPVSMFDVFETSEEDLRRFADSGLIARAISRCPTEDKDTVLRWLDRYAALGRRLGIL